MSSFMWWANAISVGLFALALLNLLLRSVGTLWRTHRSNGRTTVAMAEVTTDVVGWIVALAGAAAGIYLTWGLLLKYSRSTSPVLAFSAQLCAGFVLSAAASSLFNRLWSRPVFLWFVGEETSSNG